MPRSRRFAVPAGLVLLAACELVGIGGPERLQLQVEHYRAECQGVARSLCLLVMEPGDSTFSLHYGGIEGFTFEWGYTYRLDVDVHDVRPVPADGSSLRWVLRRVRERQRVAPGTRFDLTLTPTDGRVVEVAPDRYRFYDSAAFVCPPGAMCPELRARIAQGGRIAVRLEHPAAPEDPLGLVGWVAVDIPGP